MIPTWKNLKNPLLLGGNKSDNELTHLLLEKTEDPSICPPLYIFYSRTDFCSVFSSLFDNWIATCLYVSSHQNQPRFGRGRGRSWKFRTSCPYLRAGTQILSDSCFFSRAVVRGPWQTIYVVLDFQSYGTYYQPGTQMTSTFRVWPSILWVQSSKTRVVWVLGFFCLPLVFQFQNTLWVWYL